MNVRDEGRKEREGEMEGTVNGEVKVDGVSELSGLRQCHVKRVNGRFLPRRGASLIHVMEAIPCSSD